MSSDGPQTTCAGHIPNVHGWLGEGARDSKELSVRAEGQVPAKVVPIVEQGSPGCDFDDPQLRVPIVPSADGHKFPIRAQRPASRRPKFTFHRERIQVPESHEFLLSANTQGPMFLKR